MRKIGIAAGVIAVAMAIAVIAQIKRTDVYHTTVRRSWKNEAIRAIKQDLADSDYLKRRFRETPHPLNELEEADLNEWLTGDTIVCRDASWLAYRAACSKKGPVYDIFIARASDGKWYYTTYHFCIDACALEGDPQPKSVQQFKERYCLREFDGVSDTSLDATWPPKGEQVGGGTAHELPSHPSTARP